MSCQKNLLNRALCSGLFLLIVTVFCENTPAYALDKKADVSPPVTIYLHNATDITGTLQKVDNNGYQILTTQGSVLTVAPKSYQGMVLDTPTEKEVSNQIVHDPVTYMSAARYAFNIRQKIKVALAGQKLPAARCWSEGSPVLHFSVNKMGQIQAPQLLTRSVCEPMNGSLLNTVAKLTPEPLPKDFTPAVLPLNYVWALPLSDSRADAPVKQPATPETAKRSKN